MMIRRCTQAVSVFCFFVACSALSFGVSSPTGSSATVPATCTGGSSLNGWYGIMVSGGRYLSGAVNFNGACGLTGSSLTGALSGQASSTTSVTGTYGQNSDGTYNLTLNLAGQSAAQTYTMGISASGTKAVGIESDNSAVAVIDIESQLTSLSNGYNTASLTGAYAVSCSGSGVDLNYVTFDGKGNLSGSNPYDNGSGQGSNTYSGTYSVNSDGSFSGALTGSYSSYTFNGVIDNGLTEIEYTYDQNGNEVISCSGRQSASTTANLTGYYGMVVGGNATNGLGGGKYLSGSVYFNGAGTLSATNLNGGINTQYVNSTATGTYVVNSDNTITITMTLSGQTTVQTYIVAVSEGGNEADGIETDGTAQAIIDLQAQLVNNSTSYSTASLNGTYAAYCAGSEVDVNYVTFDGNGNQTGVDPYDNGSYGDNPYVGTYTVNPDGTFSGGFSGAYASYTLTGVIDNANSEIEYTYNYATDGGQVYCIGDSTYGPVGTNPVAAAPSFNPAPGSYSTAQTVTLSSSTPGAKIYYTTNGVTPTSSSLPYSTTITVNPNTTIEAIAVATGYNNSPIAAGTYFLGAAQQTAATPMFSPLPGTYPSTQSVTLSDTTPGAVIHYTTNGNPPNATSPVYSTPISVSTTTTIEAIAIATGYSNSMIATGLYTITPTAATPTFNPLPGTFSSTQSVTLSDTTPGAVIHYTTNGTAPGATSPVYSTPISVSTTTTIEAIAIATGYNNSLVATGVYTISPVNSGGTVVNLSSYYNVDGIASVGTPPKNGGFDNASYAYNSSLLGTSLTYQGLSFTLGPVNAADAVDNQTISLPTGQYSQIVLLGAGTFGSQINQSIVVNYTDGSNSTFTQSFSDWGGPKGYTGETTVSSTATRITPNGTVSTNGPWYVYGYTFALTAGKTVSSVKLPNNRNVIFLGIGLTGQAGILSGYYNAFGIATVGNSPPGGGFDNDGYSYNSSLLGTSLSYQGQTFTLGSPNVLDAVFSQTMSVTAGQYNQLFLLGAAVNGAQTNQGVVVYYTDGSSTTFTQNFSDWAHPSNYSGETTVIQTANRITPSGQTQNGTFDVYGYAFSLNSSKTVSRIGLPNSRNVVFLAAGLGGTAAGTPIVPYIQVGNGAWQQISTVTVGFFTSVNLGPQPLTGGSWSWTGPNGYTSTSRQINNIPLYFGTNNYVATYTNTAGVKTTQVFTITLN
jgi:hypothetical protein